MEWKKIASMEYGKIVFHSIPYHALAVGSIILLVDNLGLDQTRKWFVIDIMYLKMRKVECWSENDHIDEYMLTYHLAIT